MVYLSLLLNGHTFADVPVFVSDDSELLQDFIAEFEKVFHVVLLEEGVFKYIHTRVNCTSFAAIDYKDVYVQSENELTDELLQVLTNIYQKYFEGDVVFVLQVEFTL